MNAQTPGPLTPRRSHEDASGPLFDLDEGETRPFVTLYAPDGSAVVRCHDLATIRDADARLLAAGFNAFDRAGRSLGIDAATLAERLDLGALILAARRALTLAKRGLDVTKPASDAFVEFATLETSMRAALSNLPTPTP